MLIARQRRAFLKGSLGAGLLGLATAFGLIHPSRTLAAWPVAAFDAKQVTVALNSLFGHAELVPMPDDITLSVPDLAENGAVVPVTVQTTLPGIESILLLVEKNPNALVAHFRLAPGTQAYVKTNIKMAETSSVVVVLKAGDTLYTTSKKVRVTLNGCGN